MQKYFIEGVEIPQDKRADVNEKVLAMIDAEDLNTITKQDIFSSYTGIGGLHGLDFKDFKNYYEYGKAKKEIEAGQFFTPHSLSKEVAMLIDPSKDDLVADIACGMGNFFNYFEERNCYGWELEPNAGKVAQALYPDATIEIGDFRYARCAERLDYVIGNPPFNLRMTTLEGSPLISQLYFFSKASELLKPGGFVVAIVPNSFLKDELFNKSDIWKLTNEYNFVGQSIISANAFKQMGVASFNTKVMCWQKKSEHLEHELYRPDEYVSFDVLKKRIADKKETTVSLRHKINGELTLLAGGAGAFVYKTKKLLYEICTQPALTKERNRSLDLLDMFSNQQCPANMDYSDWYKKHRLTEARVLGILKKTVAKQGAKTRTGTAVIKRNYDIIHKAYTFKDKKDLPNVRDYTINRLITGDEKLGVVPKGIANLIERKKNKFEVQNKPFGEMEPNIAIGSLLRRFFFLNKEGTKCYFNLIQRTDINKIIQKDFSILAWQMGGGKTAAGYFWSLYKPQRNMVIISTSLAINLTWVPFLRKNGSRAIVVKTLKDLNRVRDGDFILLSFHYISKYHKQLKRFMRVKSYKINVLFDESDEITNHQSAKTRKVLSIFRKCKRKLLTTGTTTRNSIAELYPQLELLYNNSVNLMSQPREFYVQNNKGIIVPKDNPYHGKPFPAYYGQGAFKKCFNPSKTTVFGIQKQNQDVYNQDDLRALIEKTVITRKFREIAGDKYKVENVRVMQDPAERAVYSKIIHDIDKILPDYFNSTGNAKADAMLKILRQLMLLIEATSTPQLFDFYTGGGVPMKAKKIKEMISQNNEKIAIGCTSVKGTEWYYQHLTDAFPMREVFIVTGENSTFKQREAILKEFEATENGILVSTQQSLKSSVNIPSCDMVIIESLQWNIPKIEQFYFRFIRYDSDNSTQVYFVNYTGTIELNLLALLMAKEKLNDYIKTLEYKDNSAIYGEYDIDVDILNSLITKQKDEDGKIKITWGEAKAS